MENLFSMAGRLLAFLRDDLVPFFSEIPSHLAFPYYDISEGAWDTYNVPWPFDCSLGEFLLFNGLVFILSYRLYRYFVR